MDTLTSRCGRTRIWHYFHVWMGILLVCCMLCSCAVSGVVSTVASVGKTALDLVGLRSDELKKPSRDIQVSMKADKGLNRVGTNGPANALVVRVYKLKQYASFIQMPYDGFLNAKSEKELLGDDLIEVHEVILIPGQSFEVKEKVAREAAYVGIVALFNNPAPARWRQVFPADVAESKGIALGMHACSMTIGEHVVLVDESERDRFLKPGKCL